jgi:hypothetical protein
MSGEPLEISGRDAGQTSSAITTISIEPPSSIDQSPKSRPKTRRSAVEIANSDTIISLVRDQPCCPLVRATGGKVQRLLIILRCGKYCT